MIRNLVKIPYLAMRRGAKRIRNAAMSTKRILLYHRIAVLMQDPHRLAVRPEYFREHMRYLKKQNGAFEITFDDGYTDNLLTALPILQEFSIPATVFVSSGFIKDQRPFSWDGVVPMTIAQLRELSRHPLITIGAHTLSHPKLSQLSLEDQRREITQSKCDLEELIGKPVEVFAYPFGGYNTFTPATVRLVREAGYRRGYANIHERATDRSDPFTLPRFVVRDWDLREFQKQFELFL